MAITIYTNKWCCPSDFFDRGPDGVAPFEYDLMIEGLSESEDIEQQEDPRWGHVVILKGTTATRNALEEIKGLVWVADVTLPMSALVKEEPVTDLPRK